MRTVLLAALTMGVLLVGIWPHLPAAALPPYGSIIDLDSTPPDFAVLGDDPADQVGIGLATGDLNGDTVDDLFVGAFYADGPGAGGPCGQDQPGDRCNAGEAYVIYGDAGLSGSLDLSTSSADVTIYGANAGDNTARNVAYGNINGDAYGDLIIGTVWADPGGRINAGVAYIVYGGPNLPAIIDLAAGDADVMILGADTNDHFGYAVAAGDLNGDSIDDLIISALQGDGSGTGTACGEGAIGDYCEAGEAYVFYGGPGFPATIDLSTTSADLTVYGGAAGDVLSRSATTGDLNGDGIDDLLIGAYEADSPSTADTGVTYVVYGGPSLPTTIDLSLESADLTIFGEHTGDRFGWMLAAGDINGDATDDLVIGAFVADPVGRQQAGQVYVLYGDTALPAQIDLASTAPDIAIYGAKSQDRAGFSVGVVELNNDAYADIAIGSIWASPGGRTRAGEAYVIYGEETLASVIDLNLGTAGLTILGDNAEDWFGWSIISGNLNDDAFDDLFVGALQADPGGRFNAGQVYAIWGGTVEPTPTPTPAPPKQPHPGDTDGDGCSDMQENGPDETLGGRRDYLNPYDYYDVYGPAQSPVLDGVIDLPNDVLGVVQHFSPAGAPPYDVIFDRGPSSGPNPWNMTAPDGVIDLPNDVLGVINQFNHRCV
ncbi:MAG: FG-GAP repeat protein [Chloroflexi bacterium]|nr:FG-GAP repeat protein [Chloroflexota bacterium]